MSTVPMFRSHSLHSAPTIRGLRAAVPARRVEDATDLFRRRFNEGRQLTLCSGINRTVPFEAVWAKVLEGFPRGRQDGGKQARHGDDSRVNTDLLAHPGDHSEQRIEPTDEVVSGFA